MCIVNVQGLKYAFIMNNPMAEYGINAAVQHNRLYAQATTNLQRDEVKDYWRTQLDDLGAKYAKNQTFRTFLYDVNILTGRMNAEKGMLFTEMGFRFSHAQKSFSVYLKNRWCHGLIPAPPFCPIDSTVLNLLGRPWNNHPWTQMTEEEYRSVAKEILKRAGLAGLTAAQWELVLFTRSFVEE